MSEIILRHICRKVNMILSEVADEKQQPHRHVLFPHTVKSNPTVNLRSRVFVYSLKNPIHFAKISTQKAGDYT